MTAAMTGMGRSSFGIAQALASRYATPSAIFWAALIVLAVSVAARARRDSAADLAGARAARRGAMVSLAAIGLAQREFRFAGHSRAFELQRASDALLSAVNDVPRIRTLYPDMNLVNNVMLPVLKARRLNVFAVPEPWPLDSRSPRAVWSSDPAQCLGHVDRVAPVRGPRFRGARLGVGRAAHASRSAGSWSCPRSARVVGFGSSGQARPRRRRAGSGSRPISPAGRPTPALRRATPSPGNVPTARSAGSGRSAPRFCLRMIFSETGTHFSGSCAARTTGNPGGIFC